MTDPDWQELERLFHEVADLDTGARQELLERDCVGRPELARRVEDLVRNSRRSDDPVSGAVAAAVEGLKVEAVGLQAGSRIGVYEILGELGRGGQSTVFEARRADGSYEATVAIKVIRGGLVDEGAFRRFEEERRILASLEHPNIARLLDAGRTPDGLPFMVMERVEGLPITDYCDRERLPVEERVLLIRSVCEAVDFAHRKLVVHRDLKPANILVDAAGVPKLLDFGIAKLLDPGDESDLTRTHHAVLTPGYSSPEQLRGDPVTVAVDVHGLGLVLFEVLTGGRAFHFPDRSPATLHRVVCEDEPPALHQSVQQGPAEAAVAAARSVGVRQLRRMLAGDLGTIAATALRKDPARRYSDAGGLAADLGAWVEQRPIAARRDTFGYRAQRFVSRNRVPVGIALLVLLFSGVAFLQVAQERDTAEQRRRVAAEVSDFLVSIVGGEAPTAGGATSEAVLTRGESRIEALADQAAVQAGMMDAMGRLALDLGHVEDGRRMLQRALLQRIELFGDRDPDAVSTLVGLGRGALMAGAFEDAIDTLSLALDAQRDLGVDPFQARMLLASALQQSGDAGQADAEYALVEAESLGNDRVRGAEAGLRRAEIRFASGDTAGALARSMAAEEDVRSVLAGDHPLVAFAALQRERFGPDAWPAGPLRLAPPSMHSVPISTPFEAITGDFDGDGAEEILWNHRRDGVNELYVGRIEATGRVRPGPVQRHPEAGAAMRWEDFSLHTGDLNGDGVTDLLWAHADSITVMYPAWGRTSGGFDFGSVSFGPNRRSQYWRASRLQVFDLNRDGLDDAVWIHAPRMVAHPVFATAEGSFVTPTSWRQSVEDQPSDYMGAAPHALTGDLDGDGYPELLFNWLEDGNAMYWSWWSDEDLLWQGPTRYGVTGAMFDMVGFWHFYDVAMADVDGDGRDDVVWTDPATPHAPADTANRVYVAHSRAGILDPVIDTVPWGVDGLTRGDAGPFETQLGDVNGDGRADLVWNHRSAAGANRSYVSLAAPEGHFGRAARAYLHPEGLDWTRAMLFLMDTDGDGRKELVWNTPGGVNRVDVARWGGPGG